ECATPGDQTCHVFDALDLEARVPDGQCLIDDEDIWVDMACHRESEPERLTAGIHLHRHVDGFAEFRELHDVVEPPADLTAGHADDPAIEPDVLAPRELRTHAGPDLSDRSDAAARA